MHPPHGPRARGRRDPAHGPGPADHIEIAADHHGRTIILEIGDQPFDLLKLFMGPGPVEMQRDQPERAIRGLHAHLGDPREVDREDKLVGWYASYSKK